MNSIQTVLLQIEMYRLSEQNSPVIWLTQVFSPLDYRVHVQRYPERLKDSSPSLDGTDYLLPT